MYRVSARYVRPASTIYRQFMKQFWLVRRPVSSSTPPRRYDGIDLRTGRDVTSTISKTFVLDPTEALLQGNGSRYLDDMLQSWRVQPDSVHPSWQKYFEGSLNQIVPLSPHHLPASYSRWQETVTNSESGSTATLTAKVLDLISCYQRYGHLMANTNPLGSDESTFRPAELELSYHGLEAADPDSNVHLEAGQLSQAATMLPLKKVIKECQSLYCGTYGVEFTHIPDHKKRAWIKDQIHKRPKNISLAEKKRILRELMFAATFERFLSTKFPHAKRYGLDGAEGVATTVGTILDYAADEFGTEEVVVGSCHRGRMTMLPCVWRKPMQTIFAEFQGATNCDPAAGFAGDVKYHLGQEGKRRTNRGKEIQISLLPNPSHLEVITAVAAGKAFASRSAKKDPSKVLSLALHGDSAFAGQGVVYEFLGLSKLPSYNVGGSIRVMVNNQIGFTTDRESARSSHYCTDILKYLDIPVFHVNGDDVETLAWVAKLAVEWHATFNSDIVIDVVCYRKYGHNEIDQPSLTQPVMYRKIAGLRPPLEQYVEKLIQDRSFTSDEIDQEKQRTWDAISREYSNAQKSVSDVSQRNEAEESSSTRSVAQTDLRDDTSTTSSESLANLMTQLNTIPDQFRVHRTVTRVLEARSSAFVEGTVDWATAEALAFGTLIKRGYNVRLTGQDVQRGTFSQRHAVLHDQETGKKWIPLRNLENGHDQGPRAGSFLAANSPLTEYATLAFEYGHSLASPNSLTIWEAQFGDFANLAQVVIDNLISSGRSKWQLDSHLVLSLPHGYDGQGAEHSSARLERFLTLCNEDGSIWPSSISEQLENCNMQIVCPTTPANYFHILRSQMLSKHKRPLAIFFSKSLLRHPYTRSSVSELESSTSSFKPVLTDPHAPITPISVTRVILCTGQIYAALHAHREANDIQNTAIIRLEQLHPFPFNDLRDCLETYVNTEKIIWAQEEPYNGGAWHYVRDRLDTVLSHNKEGNQRKVRCVSRPVSAVSAVGSKTVSDQELEKLLENCFGAT